MQFLALFALLFIASTDAASHYNTKADFHCPSEDIARGCVGPKDCLYVNPTDAKSYIECNDAGIAFVIGCPSDLVWNDDQKYCDREENVVKHPTVIFDCPVADIAETACLGPKDCLYQHPSDCSKFIHCEVNADGKTGRPTVQDCPAGLQWNDKGKICDWPEHSQCKAECKPDVKPQPFVCPTEDIIRTQCMGPKDCLYEHSNDCRLFIHCEVNANGRTGRPTIKRCPAGLLWNDALKICDWPWNSQCIEDVPCPDPEPPRPTPPDNFVCNVQDIAITGCRGPKDCLYPFPGDCSKFIHCEVNADRVTGTPVVKDCPAGLQWNDKQKICDWPWDSTCHDNDKPNDDCHEPPVKDVCPREDIINGCLGPKDCLYPYAKDCSKFIHCEVNADGETGRPTVKNCPEGLLWNDGKKICDWPWNSHCGRHAECKCGLMFGDFCGSRANEIFSHSHPVIPLKGDGCQPNVVYGCAREGLPATEKHYCKSCYEHDDIGQDACLNSKFEHLI